MRMPVIVALMFLLHPTVIHAENWTTTDGSTYNNVRVISHDSTVVTVSYDNSTSRISASELSNAVHQGIVGSVSLPISSLDKVIQQTILDDQTTALNWATSDGNEAKYAKAVTDLCSESPQVRSKAAGLIRDNHLYRPTNRDPWDKWAAGLKVGESLPEVVDYLHKRGIGLLLPTNLSLSNGVIHFPLDDSWALLCAINHAVLTEYGIYEEPKEIVVLPPPQFSGYWHTYRINGEAIRARYYDKGKPMILQGSDGP